MATSGTEIRSVFAVPSFDSGVPLDPAVEYYGIRLFIRHIRSAGDGACADCSAPLGLFLKDLVLYQDPSGVNNYVYGLPFGPNTAAAYVNWQCPGHPVTTQGHGSGWELLGWEFDCSTPTHGRTWGQIKSLYR